MNDDSGTLSKKRRRASRKSQRRSDALPTALANDASDPAVRAILEHALHTEQEVPALGPEQAAEPGPTPAPRRRKKRKAKTSAPDASDPAAVAPARERHASRKPADEAAQSPATEVTDEASQAQVPDTSSVESAGEALAESGDAEDRPEPISVTSSEHEPEAHQDPDSEVVSAPPEHEDEDDEEQPIFVDPPLPDHSYQEQEMEYADHGSEDAAHSDSAHDDGGYHDQIHHEDEHHDADQPRHVSPVADGHEHHHWVYLALAVFLLSLGFGLWGVWATWFADRGASGQSVTALRATSDRLNQEVATLRRSDQISREANRDLQRTLAERDEEIAGLRADVAFYERFVGATGQRRGLSVHELTMARQGDDAWHFVATLTQNVNRGAVNSGRLTLGIEGTRNDRMERLSWSSLRKQSTAPGLDYSFKYFEQVEGEVILPADFKPLRITVRLVPAGGSAVEQSFPWPEAVHGIQGN